MDSDILKGIIEQFPGILDDKKKFKAVILDYYPDNKLIRNMIYASFEERIPHDIMGASVVSEADMTMFVKRLTASYGYQQEQSVEIVKMWYEVLGISEHHSNGNWADATKLLNDLLNQAHSILRDYYSRPIDCLGLNDSIKLRLDNCGIYTIGQLLSNSEEGLLKNGYIDSIVLDIIKSDLQHFNTINDCSLSFKDNDDEEYPQYINRSEIIKIIEKKGYLWQWDLFACAMSERIECIRVYQKYVNTYSLKEYEGEYYEILHSVVGDIVETIERELVLWEKTGSLLDSNDSIEKEILELCDLFYILFLDRCRIFSGLFAKKAPEECFRINKLMIKYFDTFMEDLYQYSNRLENNRELIKSKAEYNQIDFSPITNVTAILREMKDEMQAISNGSTNEELEDQTEEQTDERKDNMDINIEGGLYYVNLNNKDERFLDSRADNIFLFLNNIFQRDTIITNSLFTLKYMYRLKELCVDALGTLTEREQTIIRMRNGLDDGNIRSLNETANEFSDKYGLSISGERIRQIEAKAYRKLSHTSRTRYLNVFFDEPNEEQFASDINYSKYFEDIIQSEINSYINTGNSAGLICEALIDRYNNVKIENLNLDISIILYLKNKGYYKVVDLKKIDGIVHDKHLSDDDLNKIKCESEKYNIKCVGARELLTIIGGDSPNLITRIGLKPLQVLYWISHGCLYSNDWVSCIEDSFSIFNKRERNDKGIDLLFSFIEQVCIIKLSKHLVHELKVKRIDTVNELILNLNRLSSKSRDEAERILDQIRLAEEKIKEKNEKLGINDELLRIGRADLALFYNHSVCSYLLEDLGLSVRTYNCLKRAGIKTLGDILLLTQERLMKIRNLGRKSWEEVLAKLAEYGLYWVPN